MNDAAGVPEIVDNDSMQTLVLLVIFALASLLHGISGLGVTLVTTTALASIYPLPHAIVLTIFPSLLLNAMTWLAGGGRTIWQILSIMVGAIGCWL